MNTQTAVGIGGTGLTHGDLAQNTAQAILKAIPVIGESLSQFIFGPLQDIRWRRLEQTLGEIGKAVKEGGRVDSEEFIALLEQVGPRVARETSERRRQFFRDLLINATAVPPGSPKWADANLVSDMIASIDPPGLAILAGVSRFPRNDNAKMSSDPSPHVFNGRTPQGQQPVESYALDYGWEVLAEWVWRLKEKRLLGLGSVSGQSFGALQLSELGEFVVKWGTAKE